MTEAGMTGPPTARPLHEICQSARQQPAATAAICQASRVRSAPVVVIGTANAVGLYGPPGFKSPILRHLSSSYARALRPGGLLFFAFRVPCVAPAWPPPSSDPLSISLVTCADARASAMPGIRAGSAQNPIRPAVMFAHHDRPRTLSRYRQERTLTTDLTT